MLKAAQQLCAFFFYAASPGLEPPTFRVPVGYLSLDRGDCLLQTVAAQIIMSHWGSRAGLRSHHLLGRTSSSCRTQTQDGQPLPARALTAHKPRDSPFHRSETDRFR